MKEGVKYFLTNTFSDIFSKFIEMPIAVKVIIILIVVIVMASIILKLIGKKRRKRNSIKNCVSHEDKRYELNLTDKKMIEKLDSNKTDIQQAIKISKGRIHASWLSSHNEIIRVSSNLEANIRAYESGKLDTKKFTYYCGLHFRSMLAADFSYKEYKQIESTFNEINETLLLIGKGKLKVSKDEKKVLYGLKDEIKDIKNYWKSRVNILNQKTGEWRRKIGSECGERGRQWERARMNHN